MTLSPAAITILNRAAERADRLLQFHRKLPALARGKMIDALRRDRLIRGETSFGDCDPDTGLILTSLEVTDEGVRAMGREPSAASEATTPAATPTAPLAPPEPGQRPSHNRRL